MTFAAYGSSKLRLFLMRHGETEWSLSGQHTGRTDIPLTANGEREAAALTPWLSGIEFTHVLTSPRQRAHRTAALAAPNSSAVIEPDLVEWDYGDYEGERTVEIHKDRPDWSLFQDGCPGGETPDDVHVRAERLIERLRTLSGDVALFSHGQLACALSARWIGLPVVDAQHLSLGTASLSILSYDKSHPDVATIALWNASPSGFRSNRG